MNNTDFCLAPLTAASILLTLPALVLLLWCVWARARMGKGRK